MRFGKKASQTPSLAEFTVRVSDCCLRHSLKIRETVRGGNPPRQKTAMKKFNVYEKTLIGIIFVIFAIYAVTLIFPFVWCFYNSFKTNNEFFGDVWAMPKVWLFGNWSEALRLSVNGINIIGMFGNSILIVVVNTTIRILMSSMTAYIIAKYPFKGSGAFYSLALVLMMIPSVGSMAATYKLYNNIGLYDTYFGIFIGAFGGFGSSFVLLFGFFKNLDWSYAEAAFIDGANDYSVFFKIMLPMAMPGLTAVGILSAIGVWNDYFTIYMFAPSKVTIAVGLQGLVNRMQYQANYPLLFAVMIMSIIPVIAVFATFQKTIMENTTIGGVKG